jgi:Tol biopolymer transport system component
LSVPDGTPRRVGDVRADSAAWSPDDRRIAVVRDGMLETCNPDGSGIRRLAEFTGFGVAQPRWSPDGKVIWVAAITLGTYQVSLWEVDRETGARRAVLPAGYEPLRRMDVGPGRFLGRWFPDGSYLLVAVVAGGRNSIWAVPRSSRRPVQLTFGPLEYYTPAASPDGKKIFAIGGQRRGEVMRWDAQAHQFVRLGAGLSADGVEFSPDGHWIAWVAYPEGSLWRSRPDGSEKLELIAPPSVTYLPRWSPDGQRIAVMVREPGTKWKICIVPAHGGSTEVLLPGAGPEADPNWSPDGRKLVYAPFPFDVPPGRAAVYTVDMDTRQVTKLPGSEELFSPRWSPDGRYITAGPNGGNIMKLFDLSSGRWRTLVLPTEPSFPLWSRDSRYLHVGTPSGPARVRVSDGSMEIIAPLHGIDLAGNLYFWTGLDASGAPMILRDLGNRDIYALQLAQ